MRHVLAEQVPDVLGPPWVAETLTLPPDDEGPVVATLVGRRTTRTLPESGPRRAVLHVHGFADYFFHAAYGQWWADRGYDVYALDLRKYGRSIRPHQTPTYIADLHDYFAELELAWWRITERDGHDHVVISAHSTGGLTTALWAHHRRPDALAGLFLNSPWFDLQGPPWMRSPAAGAALEQVGGRQPMRVIPREVSGDYGRSLHADYDGEWTFDLAWKPIESFPARAGWLRAVRRGHAELHAGLDVAAPVLVMTSGTSDPAVEPGPHRRDIVLQVPQIRRWATAVGPHVTYVAVPGARHDVVLSLPEPRARVYDELQRWARAYL